jgi:glycosyltransferase involved in cell wall biosynthesis
MSDPSTILFLTQVVPYPPDAGPRIKTWNVLRHLHQTGHKIILLTLVRDDELDSLPYLRPFCQEIHTVRLKRTRWNDLLAYLRSFVVRKPFLVERDNLKEMRELTLQIVRRQSIDIIHADQLSMIQFAFYDLRFRKILPQRGKVIFDAHNAVWSIVDRMAKSAKWYLRPSIEIEAARLKRYEENIVLASDVTFTVTTQDKLALMKKNSESKIVVVPIAIDTGQNPVVYRGGKEPNILTLGTLHYPPNADGIRWFVNEVFPWVISQKPEVHLTILGKNPPKDFYGFADRSNGMIEVTGYVKDLNPYYEKASIVVVPVRAGGGMRVRILEAFSKGMPVVTTTMGLEGIEAVNGKDVVVEDDPRRFANAIVKLIDTPEFRSQLSCNGRLLVEKNYDWRILLDQLDHFYQQNAIPRTE